MSTINKQLLETLEDLKAEQSYKRKAAIENLSQLATAFGADRCKNELIPFINQNMLDDDNIEVLTCLAEQIPKLLKIIGISNVSILYNSLETLSKTNDQILRQTVIESFQQLYSQLDLSKFESQIMQQLKKMFNSEAFTTKHICAALIPYLYPKVSKNSQNELANLFLQISNDQSSIVRRFAAENLKNLITLLPNLHENEILFIFQKLSRDDQDFTRIYLLDCLESLCTEKNRAKQRPNILNFAKLFAEDASWRIRFMFCEKIVKVAEALDQNTVHSIILPFYIKYLQDEEPEMKAKALSKLDTFCPLIDPNLIIQQIMPLLKTLSTDSNNYVRAELALRFQQLSPILGRQRTEELIFALFLALLKDKDSSIRVNLFQNFSYLVQVLGIDQIVNQIIPAFKLLTEDKNWRNRIIVLQHLPFLAKIMSQVDFGQHFLKFPINMLKDTYYDVRMTSTKTLGEIGKIYDSQWIEKIILPLVNPISQAKNYLHRIVYLCLIEQLAPSLNSEKNASFILQTINNFAKDPVPNLRVKCAQVIGAIIDQVKDKVIYYCQNYYVKKTQYKKIMKQLLSDQDSDVKDYTNKIVKERGLQF